jgi:hypothetical protein
MRTLRTTALALTFLSGAAFFAAPTFAVEPDTDSSSGPELPAPRNVPGFQTDDQTGATKLVPHVELADPEVILPHAEEVVPVPPPPDIVAE